MDLWDVFISVFRHHTFNGNNDRSKQTFEKIYHLSYLKNSFYFMIIEYKIWLSVGPKKAMFPRIYDKGG